MSPRTTKKRRRGKGQPTATAGNGSPATLLSQVSELVNENQALVRENKELHSIIARVTHHAAASASPNEMWPSTLRARLHRSPAPK